MLVWYGNALEKESSLILCILKQEWLKSLKQNLLQPLCLLYFVVVHLCGCPQENFPITNVEDIKVICLALPIRNGWQKRKQVTTSWHLSGN
jgi:hypothetical protein